MPNFFRDNADLKYYLDKGLDWTPLVELTEYDFKAEDGFKDAGEAVAFYRDILDLVGDFSAEQIAPLAAAIDKKGVHMEGGEVKVSPELDGLFKQMKEMELYGMSLPRELGGMNCPMVLHMINTEILARGDTSVMAHYGFHGGIAMTLLFYSILEGSTELQKDPPMITKTRFEEVISEIRDGKAWGSMDITESGAGSDMAALRAKGEQDEDGNWFVSGEKIFITSGHAKWQLVVAQTEEEKSLKGLSLFLVKTYDDNKDGTRTPISELPRIEEKIGHHGSVTATQIFDRTPAQLIGNRGDGFKLMLLLMNNARVSVGFESIGVMEAVWRLATEYAAERPSMGKTIDRHEMIADYLDEMRTDIQGIRALAMSAAYNEEMGQKLGLKADMLSEPGSDEQKRLRKKQRRHAAKARFATPLLKYLGAERSVHWARMGIQIHGGNGYSTEFGAEKLLRDALVFPIYEGTSQIQALMAMKDSLASVMKDPQGFVKDLAQARWASMSARNPMERRVARIKTMALSAQQHLVTQTAKHKLIEVSKRPLTEWMDALTKNWDPKRDFNWAMLHAERLCNLLGDAAVSEILLEQAQKHPERQELLVRYLERAEPRARYYLDMINNTGERLLAELDRANAADPNAA